MENLALWYRRFGEPETVLQPETAPLGALAPGHLRVRMLFSPVNASDLIPITGAYRHRTPLPAVAGYEGVGIVTDAPASFAHLLGKRVLIAWQSTPSPFRTLLTHVWPRGPISTRWRRK